VAVVKLERYASAIGKGLVAGAAGTALMTLSSTIEMKLRGRKSSDMPAKAAGKVLGVTPVGEEEKKRFGTLVHWGYGTALGATRGILAAAGLGPVSATAAHFAWAWGQELVAMPALGVMEPPTQIAAQELAIDAFHHAVYALGAGVAYRLLDRD
jgi:hypothetical protein